MEPFVFLACFIAVIIFLWLIYELITGYVSFRRNETIAQKHEQLKEKLKKEFE